MSDCAVNFIFACSCIGVVVPMKTTGLAAVAAAALLLSDGCSTSSGQSAPSRTAKSSLKQISVLFGQYCGRHSGQGPKNEAEFRKFIADNGQRSLKAAAVSSVDDLLTSPRDHQPFQVRYGVKAGPPGTPGGRIVAYEKTGVNGSRLVVDPLGKVREVDQQELDGLLKN
jgi:hypothetical protein